MSFNYLQTDDRDDYFSQFDRSRNSYPMYSFKLPYLDNWSSWVNWQTLKNIIRKQMGVSSGYIKTLSKEQILKEAEKINIKIHYERIPYITGYPEFKGI